MQVILPVAGLGTRLRPQTWSRPKPLVTVAGKALIDHVLDRLEVLEPERVVFVTGYLGEQIEEHVRECYDGEAVFVEQEEPLGQSHAVLQARDVVEGPVVVLFPDMVFEADLTPLKGADFDGALFVMPVDDPSRFGVVVKDGDRVERLVEKPSEPISNLAVMGIYYFKDAQRLMDVIERQIREEVVTKGEYFLADAIQMLIDDGAYFVTLEASLWQDAGTNQALLETNRYLLDQIDQHADFPGSVIVPPSLIDPTADVRHSVIGPYASIGAGAEIIGSIIRDSIVDEGALVDGANLQHSIVGRDAILRGRLVRANIGDSAEISLANRDNVSND